LSFTEPLFLVYVVACAALNSRVPARFRAGFLLLASYIFYFTWSIPAAGLLAGLTILAYVTARKVDQERAGDKHGLAWLGIATVIFLVACLAAFKIALLTPSHGIAGLVMPLGISYYTFKLISYVLEVHWGKLPAETDFINFASYVAFFPQIVAGPIQRPGDFLAQLPAKPQSATAAWSRIAWGFAKKLVIADNLAPIVNAIYSHVSGLHGLPLLLGFYVFPLQLYADFSGLTDIAIGVGRLFGITGPENFNRPYTRTSVSEFWRYWHMSLTTWLQDYVFVPLRMATREAGNLGLVISLTAMMVAIGLWHGVSVGFLVFGLLNAAYLSVDALTGRRRGKFFKKNPRWNTAGNWLGWLLTFHLVLLSEVFWRAPRFSDALVFLGSMWRGIGSSTPLFENLIDSTGARALLVGLVGYLIMELGERYRPDLWIRDVYFSGPRWVRWSFTSAGVVIGTLCVALLIAHAGAKKSPFLYEIF